MVLLVGMPIASGASGRVDVGVDTSIRWTPYGLRAQPVIRQYDSYLMLRWVLLRQDRNTSSPFKYWFTTVNRKQNFLRHKPLSFQNVYRCQELEQKQNKANIVSVGNVIPWSVKLRVFTNWSVDFISIFGLTQSTQVSMELSHHKLDDGEDANQF